MALWKRRSWARLALQAIVAGWDGAWRSLASASEWGSEGRKFESCRPDSEKPSVAMSYGRLSLWNLVGERHEQEVDSPSRRHVRAHQPLREDFAAKRRILEIICLNFRLDGATLCPTMRKPFDIVAEGLVLNNSRGDKI